MFGLKISWMDFHVLETILWPLQEYMSLPHPFSTNMGKVDIRKVKADQQILLPPCMPSPLSLVSNLEEKASGFCIDLFGNRYFIFLNSKLNGKVLGIELKQCLLWAQVSNFNLFKVGYYPVLPLAVIAFTVVHCLLLYILYCILVLYIRYTNGQSFGLGAISWPNVPSFKLSTCFLFMISGMDSHFVRQRGRF